MGARIGPVLLCKDCRHFRPRSLGDLRGGGDCACPLRPVVSGCGEMPELQDAHNMRYSGPCGYTAAFWMPIREDQDNG
jgi:hypothetical protein